MPPDKDKIDPEHVDITILVIDDDAMVRSVIADYLKSFGFNRIIEAESGRAALRIIQDKNTPLHLILSDWEMPEIDGLTVLKAVRNNPMRAQTRFIMITSQKSQEREKISKAKDWRVNAYIVKPFRGDTLRDKVWTVLGWKSSVKVS